MTEPLKVMVGPSSHYHQLKSGQIKYQKSKPANPIWRILILSEAENRMHSRTFPSQPSAPEIEQVILGMLPADSLPSTHIVVPATVEKMCPGLQEKLMSNNASVYVPAHGFASGSRAGREWEKFLSCLEMSLNMARESMASCDEIASASGNPLGVVSSDLWLSDHKDSSHFNVAYDLADKITCLRGRDPEVGRKLRNNESWMAPLNKGDKVLPPQDVLNEILRDPNYYLMGERWGQPIWDIVQQLKKIRDAEPVERHHLLAEMGASAVLYQLDAIRNNRSDFLSSLGLCLRDASLRYQVSLGIKEAFKQLIVDKNNLLQVSAAKVTVQYPSGCVELSLRGIPAHNHLERMVQEVSGGVVNIIPDLQDMKQKFYSHPVTPVFLRSIFSLAFARSTPRSPSQCFIPTVKAGSQRVEGLLLVLAMLPKNTSSYVPLGDVALSMRMTVLVNERLARNSKGITCQIEPMETFGDLLHLGPQP